MHIFLSTSVLLDQNQHAQHLQNQALNVHDFLTFKIGVTKISSFIKIWKHLKRISYQSWMDPLYVIYERKC